MNLKRDVFWKNNFLRITKENFGGKQQNTNVMESEFGIKELMQS